MRSSSRNVSPESKLAHLEKKHAELDARLGELEALPHLPPAKALEVQKLKKLKLQAKDEMAQARRMI